MQNDTDFDIVIIGGGLAGSTLALALAPLGLRVALVDRLASTVRADPGFDGRGYTLARGSVNMLEALGLWDPLAPLAEPILDIVVSDGRPDDGPALFGLHFDHAEGDGGPMGYVLEDRHLRPALLNALAEVPGITHLSETEVTGQSNTPGDISVTLSSGKPLSARVLIGADGHGSKTAARAGIRYTSWDYPQSAIACAVSHEKPLHGAAHQLFLPQGPLAILPLPENRASVVWTETANTAARLFALDDPAFLNHLRPRFGSFLGEISLAGGRSHWPLGLSLAKQFIAPRIALVGDAAHRVHPIAGQGLNAGLRDIAALAEVLGDAARRGEDIGGPLVLERYQTWRRFDATTLALATDGFNRLFSNDNPMLRALRGLGMRAVQSAPALRRGFIREAEGLTGTLPRLIQGLPI